LRRVACCHNGRANPISPSITDDVGERTGVHATIPRPRPHVIIVPAGDIVNRWLHEHKL
jgi:hypothetical protein